MEKPIRRDQDRTSSYINGWQTAARGVFEHPSKANMVIWNKLLRHNSQVWNEDLKGARHRVTEKELKQ
jgi:hypothetical protein